MQQVTNTHVKRWKEHRHEIGYGHLYQGRYKCFPVETEDYFYQVVGYVERNALRANLVERAESRRWSSLRRVERGYLYYLDSPDLVAVTFYSTERQISVRVTLRRASSRADSGTFGLSSEKADLRRLASTTSRSRPALR